MKKRLVKLVSVLLMLAVVSGLCACDEFDDQVFVPATNSMTMMIMAMAMAITIIMTMNQMIMTKIMMIMTMIQRIPQKLRAVQP